MLARPTDRAEPQVGFLAQGIDPRPELGVEVTLCGDLGAPRAGLFDDDPPGGDDGRAGHRLVQLPAERRAQLGPAG
jgi:hypothetical protein